MLRNTRASHPPYSGRGTYVLSAFGRFGPIRPQDSHQDQDGDRREWVHGFYTTHDPGLEWPLRCDTCPIEHERVAPGRWYTYESGNLMVLLPETQRPESIVSFRFYASGHAFSVYVAELSLLGAP